MTEVITGTVRKVESNGDVNAETNRGSVLIPSMKRKPKVGDQITIAVATYDPPPSAAKPSRRKIDPNVEKGRPSIPGGK